MQKGDIVLVPFPFTDLTGTKLRPALVLFSLDDDVVVVFISTTTKIKGEYEILMLKFLAALRALRPSGSSTCCEDFSPELTLRTFGAKRFKLSPMMPRPAVAGRGASLKKSKTNSLKSDSILKLSKIVTLDKKLIASKIGYAEEDIVKQINQRLLKMFDLR